MHERTANIMISGKIIPRSDGDTNICQNHHHVCATDIDSDLNTTVTSVCDKIATLTVAAIDIIESMGDEILAHNHDLT
jgi:hypothetical protein